MFHKLKTPIIIVGAIFSMLVGIAPSVHATTYGGSGYGECYYAKDCPAASTPASPTPVPTTPQQPSKPAASSPTITVGLNLTVGQVITQKNQAIIATFYQSQNGTQTVLPATEIGWTAFYVENSLIGTIYNSTDGKTFQITWRPQKSGDQTVSAVGYSHSGSAVARTDVAVTVAKSAVNQSTPSNTGSGSGSTNTTNTPKNNKNNPGITTYFSTTFENVGFPKKIADLPLFIMQTYPLWLFIILFIIAARFWWQAIREAIAIRNIEKAIKREKELSEQKIAFIMIISHYLNTPLALIRNGTEVISGITDQGRKAVQLAVDDMKLRIDRVITATTESEKVTSIQPPTKTDAKFNPLKSKSFWFPVFGVLTVITFANILLFMLDKSSLVVGDIWFRIVILGAGLVFLALTLRTNRLRRQEHAYALQVLAYTQNLDSARSEFIQQASNSLRAGIKVLDVAQRQLNNANMTKFFDEGLAQIDETIYKLELSLLVGTNMAATPGVARVPMRQAFAQALETHQATIAQRGIQVQNQIQGLEVVAAPQLVSFIADALVDNAVKFAKDGGSIHVIETQHGLIVKDNGIGMSKQAIDNLFVPFSRGTSTSSYDYEGLGFSLYLCKLIVERLNGTLSVDSVENAGTNVKIVDIFTK